MSPLSNSRSLHNVGRNIENRITESKRRANKHLRQFTGSRHGRRGELRRVLKEARDEGLSDVGGREFQRAGATTLKTHAVVFTSIEAPEEHTLECLRRNDGDGKSVVLSVSISLCAVFESLT